MKSNEQEKSGLSYAHHKRKVAANGIDTTHLDICETDKKYNKYMYINMREMRINRFILNFMKILNVKLKKNNVREKAKL